MSHPTQYAYVIERADDGSFSAYVPDLPGCTTSGDTLDEIRQNVKQAISLCIEALRDRGEAVPPPVSLAETADVAA